MSDLCEWWPEKNRPAEYAVAPTEAGVKRFAEQDGCQNRATLLVGGDGAWRLCDACAALPAFNRYRNRRRIETKKLANQR